MVKNHPFKSDKEQKTKKNKKMRGKKKRRIFQIELFMIILLKKIIQPYKYNKFTYINAAPNHIVFCNVIWCVCTNYIKRYDLIYLLNHIYDLMKKYKINRLNRTVNTLKRMWKKKLKSRKYLYNLKKKKRGRYLYYYKIYRKYIQTLNFCFDKFQVNFERVTQIVLLLPPFFLLN